MGDGEQFRRRARATWAAGDWDSCARLVAPAGELVLDRIALEQNMDVLDVGTGSGGNIAIPAALRGAKVVGCDVTPELFEHARRRAGEAGVGDEGVEAQPQDPAFADERLQGVILKLGV